MKYSILGKSDLSVSEIGLGCMSLKDDEVENKQIIARALEMGVNFFDTADLYENGENEMKVGRLLQADRKRIILATKVGNQLRADGKGWDWNPNKDYIIAAVERSLKRLQTDYIDLYQLHGGTMDDPIDDTIAAFEILKEQGKIRNYGISSIRPNVIREYVKRSAIVSVMMQYSLLDRRPEEACFDLLEKHNIAVLGRGSVAQGLLVDKSAKAYLNWSAEEVEKAAGTVKAVSGDSATAAQTALRYALHHAVMKSAIIGVSTLAQLEDSLQTVDLPELTTAELTQLQQTLPFKGYQEHR